MSFTVSPSQKLILTPCRDRTDPSGYKVSTLKFVDGEPMAPADSNTSYTDIFANTNNSVCPGNCFRPVGMAFDGQGRMFVSSDASGEIYVVVKDASSNGTFGSDSGTGSGSSGDGGKTSDAQQLGMSVGAFLFFAFAIYLII